MIYQNNQSISLITLLFMIVFIVGCQDNTNSDTSNSTKNDSNFQLFSKIVNKDSGIDFSNNITENKEKNYFNFEYIYNGAGVATGDINNDGLVDIYFIGNEVPNKLYLNQGDFKFKDISKPAEVVGSYGWQNGVTMVDINNDGWLDIYVCVGGWMKESNKRKNLLYINQGASNRLYFKEQAAEYGLDETGYSLQSSFFDFDNDGDLDVYITNHPIAFNLSLPERLAKRTNPDEFSRDKLYRNNGNNTFTEIGKQAGIINYGHGLGIVTVDIDKDGWQDIYIANDYKEPDYLYMNNGDGTFTDRIKEMTGHIPFNAMGVDIADINNDGWEDIFTTEMLPKDYKRSKTNMASMDVKTFEGMLALGLHHQYMHNTLQLNRGNNYFSEIGQLTGMSKTDWSWSCLLSDFDNDGYKDIFVANGARRDIFDKDYKKIADKKAAQNNRGLSLEELYEIMPATKLQNFIYQNNGDLSFTDKKTDWGLSDLTVTQGAATADLDNDGDLDLVMNNLDQEAMIYQNNAEKNNNNFLKIKLLSDTENRNGIGAKITIQYDNQIQFQELKVTRGFYSSSEPIVHFGLGKTKKIDQIIVDWKNGKSNVITNSTVNQTIEIKQSEANGKSKSPTPLNTLFSEKTNTILNTPFTHQENDFNDYHKQILLPHKQSQNGPFISTGDVNGDGLEDFFIGGAHLQAGQLYLQNASGKFIVGNTQAFEIDRAYEDMGSTFFDADGDGDLDLYIVSGGFEFDAGTNPYQDRIYINDGAGNFANNSMNMLPPIGISGSCVVANDYDKDGDLDLFVGGRVVPNLYPYSPESMLLKNNNGRFENVTTSSASDLKAVGMVTSATWSDVNSDGQADLVVVGEWTAIQIFINENGNFKNETDKYGLDKTVGWWNKIVADDIDNDGDIDFVIGNLGTNHKFQASESKPFHVYCNDFDKNGSYDVVLAKNYDGGLVPIRGKQCTSEQMPFVNDKFKTYGEFADAKIPDILGNEIDQALHYKANLFESIILKNNNGSFEIMPLPTEAQFSTVNGILIDDYDNDGIKDIVLAGNMFQTEAETTRADASIGLLFKGNNENFHSISAIESGIFLPDDVKDLKSIKLKNGLVILAASNNNKLRILFNSKDNKRLQ